MAGLIEGDFQAKAIKPEFGADAKGKPLVRVDMQIVGGTHDGRRLPYEGKLDEKGIKYTKRDMIALGWKGVDAGTFVADVIAAALTVPIRVEIATWNKDDGTVKQWSTVRSIGMFAPLSELDADKLRDVNEWFREAGDVGSPANGASRAAEHSADNNDIPF